VSATLPQKSPAKGCGKPATFGNFIDGEWVPAASGKTFENRNPADGNELVGVFSDTGPEDVERAVAAATSRSVRTSLSMARA
jgi:acyl-CoA reductase-like NAD-dependent aldehyde dehydrogenase